MSNIQVGARVRFPVEGEVTRADGDYVYIQQSNGMTLGFCRSNLAAEIEVLVGPEPEWTPGDVVRAKPYTPFLRRSDDTWMTSGTAGPGPDEAARAVSEAWAAGELDIVWKDGEAVTEG
jgi:hypothetical protein